MQGLPPHGRIEPRGNSPSMGQDKTKDQPQNQESNKQLQLPGPNLPAKHLITHTVGQPFIQAKSKQIPHERRDQSAGATTTGVPMY